MWQADKPRPRATTGGLTESALFKKHHSGVIKGNDREAKADL